MEKIEIEKYINIAKRRMWWVIIPLLLTLLAGLTYAMVTPRIYQGETLILVVPQKVPEAYVQSIVHISMEERLRTIKQQVTSRTNLERIIKEYPLYTDPPEDKLLLEEKVGLFRNRIGLTVSRGTAFTISFRDKSPNTAKDVTNTLASNFISENLKIRESQAMGTSTFLADELASTRKRLEEKEELIKEYRQKHMGAMPDQLSTNLGILGRLENQLEQLNSNLRAAEERKLIIQQQIANAELMQRQVAQGEIGGSLAETETPMITQYGKSEKLISLKEQLASLEKRYTANHPDVIRLKKIIAENEAEESKTEPEGLEPQADSAEIQPQPVFSMTDLLKPQLDQINLEITGVKEEIKKVKSQAELYERRVQETPQREQELVSLSRDYSNLKGIYDSLLKRKLEAEIAVSMEQKQKGEQFRIIDPAKLPERPVRPNLRKILLLAIVLGLGLGGGLAFTMETLDTSYKTADEVEEELQLPVLVSMPIRYTEAELRSIRRKKALVLVSVGLGFILSTFGILIATKGLDKTLNFFTRVLAGS
jgi:polysaccharide chain length determinant protein (PEP-CTERM system associated)